MDGRTAWRPFLEQWSQEWVAAHDPERDGPLPEEVVRDTWLGFAPASEAEVAAAEARLGCGLPPSLREFLLVTDGWRDAGCFIHRLAGTAELAWLRDTDDRTWIEVWEGLADGSEGSDGSDGDAEDSAAQEAKVLARSLRLSLAGDAAVMLLDPEDVDEDGEWAGYWLASWSGEGPRRHGSFHDLMHRQWVSFHALRRPPGATRDHWDAEVERARREALEGALDGPLETFARAHEYGRARADVLSAQLNALLGDWQRVIANLTWYTPANEELFLGPLFAAELLPLLVRHDGIARPHALRPLPRLKEYAPGPVRALITAYEARTREPGFTLTFGGGPEFDAAVHAATAPLAAHPAFRPPARPAEPEGRLVMTVHDASGAPVVFGAGPRSDPLSDPMRLRAARAAFDEEAWPALRAAMRLWEAESEDHIAPVSLLADPLLARMLTRTRARELLTIPRGDRR